MAGGTAILGGQPSGLYLETLQEVFTNRTKKVPDLIGKMFNVKHDKRLANTYQSYSPLEDFDSWDMESGVSVEQPDAKFQTVITKGGFRKAVAYSWKLKEFQRYSYMAELAESLARAAATTKQRQTFDYINDQLAGTSGTYWGSGATDYLFSTTHDLATGVNPWHNPVTAATSTVGYNLISGALTHARLVQAIALLRLTPDDMGNPMMLEPRFLHVYPGDNEELAYRILESRAMSGTANNDANWLKDNYGKIEVVPNPWLTDVDACLLVGSEHKVVCEISHDMVQSQYVDDNTKATVHDVAFVFATGAKDWRGMVAIKP